MPASHAAVVARGRGIPAVVGVSAMQVAGQAVLVGERGFTAGGDALTIERTTGEVFTGPISVGVSLVSEGHNYLASPGWIATTASGSNLTRISSCWPGAPGRRKRPPAGLEPSV